MQNQTLTESLAAFDPEIYGLLREEIQKQRFTLSLLPTSNAVSPFSAYLKGSIFGNGHLDHHVVRSHMQLEEIAEKRAARLFGADHAIVRISDIAAASRVVFQALVKAGDTILSFNRRKSEHCIGEHLRYDFVSFSIEPKTEQIDLARVEQLAKARNPRLIIYSPVNYPLHLDYKKLGEIAQEVGAYLWVDIGQNAGAVAAGCAPSPVPYADVVTFPTGDSLHGPQSAVILTREGLAEKMDKAMLNTGHSMVKKNVLAALATTFLEAGSDAFQAYCRQVLKNAKALEKGLQDAGMQTLCGATENHLVLARLPEEQDLGKITDMLRDTGFLVKGDCLLTADEVQTFPCLRLSALDPTTRALKETSLQTIGRLLGELILSGGEPAVRNKARGQIRAILMDKPLFSDEWLPQNIKLTPGYGKKDLNIAQEVEAEKQEAQAERMWSFWDN
ncbi:glycine hydroxymethyltransferase [Selenomonas ruminantium]|uniref:Glycine hydroxymethyltransferase n=1 Tax=Selenomonas ruminantium TaxID=971 RepID=A0A1M6VXJ6_SELRU|nr:serine hydroxymethyltransferase [Selenomonas ruminantium]SHK86055.1 glycine hydroxymethyltransferase [Selenomonas ruminantium]